MLEYKPESSGTTKDGSILLGDQKFYHYREAPADTDPFDVSYLSSAEDFQWGVLDAPKDASTCESKDSRVSHELGEDLSTVEEQGIPTWFLPGVERASRILRLADDWDEDGAAAIHHSCVQRALDLLTGIMQEDTPSPHWAPLHDGRIQLEWSTRGIDLEIVIGREGPYEVLYEDLRTEGSKPWEGKVSDSNFAPLKRFIVELSSRK